VHRRVSDARENLQRLQVRLSGALIDADRNAQERDEAMRLAERLRRRTAEAEHARDAMIASHARTLDNVTSLRRGIAAAEEKSALDAAEAARMHELVTASLTSALQAISTLREQVGGEIEEHEVLTATLVAQPAALPTQSLRTNRRLPRRLLRRLRGGNHPAAGAAVMQLPPADESAGVDDRG
jgi:hypothetical protein